MDVGCPDPAHAATPHAVIEDGAKRAGSGRKQKRPHQDWQGRKYDDKAPTGGVNAKKPPAVARGLYVIVVEKIRLRCAPVNP